MNKAKHPKYKPNPELDRLWRIERLRYRAEQLRCIAEEMRSEDAAQFMYRIADDYDGMARSLECAYSNMVH